MRLFANLDDPPLASVIIGEYLKSENIQVEWNTVKSKLTLDNIPFDSDISLCRYLARSFPKYNLYGSTVIQNTEIEHWLSFSIGPLQNNASLINNLSYLNKEFSTITYLVGKQLTIADLAIWICLFKNKQWRSLSKDNISNVLRWFTFIESQEYVKSCLNSLPDKLKLEMSSSSIENQNVTTTNERKDEGKFVDLPGAEMGKVVVRFPPEASGFLHVGHAKAALLNYYYKEKFDGKFIMRFDDTNPAKEKVDFEKVILEDLEMLQIKADRFTHTSDYFDLMLKYCEKLLENGKAYVDDTDPETMKQEREKHTESKHRNNSVDQNTKMWKEMLSGSDYGVKCCVRAKIDMNSLNGCLRDPTIYRCKPESHPKTGNKYKVYPTYDFACPIVDSIEGVTHCLRTTEYHDRDEQFYWFIDALNLRKPYIYEYSRLNMTNTVLSKRKLTWFVEEGHVDGWDDPRFPTVRGILRRGMTVEGLKQFIVAQGSSRSVVLMGWDKIWAFNKKVIDPIVPRYTALESIGTVPILVNGVKTEKLLVPKHPKNDEIGKKEIWKSNRILIDSMDAEELKENENSTFINWGNLLITKINRTESKITSVEAKENLSNTDYKKTLKLTWLADVKEEPFIPCICVYFDHLITKPSLTKDENFKDFINPNTRIERKMLGDPALINVKKGDIIQLQRRGFYICDQEYKPPSIYTGCQSPIVLFFIPDGHTKETPITIHSKRETAAEIAQKQAANKSQIDNKTKTDSSKKKTVPIPGEGNNTIAITPDLLSDIQRVLDCIQSQGDRVRRLKADKCEKNVIDDEVNRLLQLKKSFKSITSKDWKPGITVLVCNNGVNSESDHSTSTSNSTLVEDLYKKVYLQACKIRYLQKTKANKNLINTELTSLADLKEKYRTEAGIEWFLGEGVSPEAVFDQFLNDLRDKIASQGNKVRKLKLDKAEKSIIESEVGALLKLKAEFKEATGADYKPPESTPTTKTENVKATVAVAAAAADDSDEKMSSSGEEIHTKIVEQGNLVRKLKGDKQTKEIIDGEVKILLELKNRFKEATGVVWTPNIDPKNIKKVEATAEKAKPTVENKKSNKIKEPAPKASLVQPAAGSGPKKQSRLGLEAKKSENLPEWYSQVITKGDLIEYYDVSGCYTLRPWSFYIWKTIRAWFDNEITKLGVEECYFPMFVSKNALEREKSHIADFSPEVAWVTKSGDSDLEEPVAIRPTSETVMYPAYAKWIRSHRDLPLKLNQWNNVVRWEFKHPQPFLRTREFLWQEGHTAYATRQEAEEEVNVILDLYAKVYTDLLAIPVVKGRKTDKEKFAGGCFTSTVEAFIAASGRGIQGATSHYLGQNFSKMFEIVFEDPKTQTKEYVHQNSWGITTRTIGVMIMVHADDQGLVLPPRVAKYQVVIVPCGISANISREENNSIDDSCSMLETSLKKAGVRVHYDSRDNYSSGWKFNHWELKGVPIRIELGPKDIKQNQVTVVRRDNGEKLVFKRSTIDSDVLKVLDNIQKSLYDKAEQELKKHTVICENWSMFTPKLNEKNIILAPFCCGESCEDNIKRDSAGNEAVEPGAPSMGAKSLCIPFDQPRPMSSTTKCIHPECSLKAKFYTLFGRSY